MLANLAAALFTHKSIKTTETKAKRLRPVAVRGQRENIRAGLQMRADKIEVAAVQRQQHGPRQ